ISFNAIQLAIQKGKIESGHDIGSGGLITSLLEMCFADNHVGMSLDLSSLAPDERVLYAENPGLIIQVKEETAEELKKSGVQLTLIGHVNSEKSLNIQIGEKTLNFDIAKYRDHWFYTSYLMDTHQTKPELAKERFETYHQTPLNYIFPENFNGKLPKSSGKKVRAAVIREKGSNSEREMAYAMHLAGFEVKDIHMTDLMSGREDLSDVQLIVAVGGFSNSDVLGSAKGWAGSFKYNPLARKALEEFFKREDTLSLGVCNGCQLFIELGLLHQNDNQKPKMLHNDSGKFECTFSTVDIKENNTVMFSDLKGARLGIWSAHGEGKFDLPKTESAYNIVGTYTYDAYPSNPNGSDYGAAILSDAQGRHVVMMPHLERSTFPWNWPHYPENLDHEASPWIEAFVAANKWLKKQG
ncbi:MAG: phosphoribosylformylglycinamidine synthase subunit PurQ, partial [Flavobacteriaceae bacterium]